MIVLDTSAVVVLVDEGHSKHQAIVDLIKSERGPLVVPTAILAEVAWVLSARIGRRAAIEFIRNLKAEEVVLDPGSANWQRVAELMDRYSDLDLDFADACVIACAERGEGKVVTLDRRDFDVVSAEIKLEIFP